MNTNQIRDELARLAGWTRICGVPGMLKEDGDLHLKWKLRHHEQWDHPMPPTLDGANAAVPEGWFPWERRKGPQGLFWEAIHPQWRGGLNPHMCVRVPDHGRGHEMEDLYALALACVRAEEAKR